MIVRQLRKHAGLFAAIAAVLAVAVQFGWSSAVPATGPVPATTNAVTLSASPVDNLGDGTTVNFTVTTSGSTKLIGNVTAHLCKHGFTSYTASNFGYSGTQASRCVYQPGIVSGGLTGADYEFVTQQAFGGTESTTGQLSFKAGTGSLTWGNVTGSGPFTIACDSANPCDLVLQVGLSGDSVATTYFIQPLNFAGGGATTTTTTSTSTTTTSSSTTTTSSTSTTTTSTTAAPTTTTTAPTTTTVNPNGSVTPSTVAPNGQVNVTSTGWDANSVVKVTLHSDPVVLGTLTADDTGKVSGAFTIPTGTATGAHTIELTYNDPAVGSRTVSLPVTVAATTTTTIAGGTGTATTGTGTSTAGALAFTGGNVRNLASVALLLLSAGLFLLGRVARRPVVGPTDVR